MPTENGKRQKHEKQTHLGGQTEMQIPGSGGGGKPPIQLITPSAGIVLKTAEKKSGKKVFVNVVSHGLVKRPVDASNREVDDEHLDRLGVRNLRVPLDVGEPKPTTDKGGEAATKCDVIFSPAVVRRAAEGAPAAQYWQAELAGLALSWVAKEMQTELSPQWKVIKGKYHGDGPEPFPWVDGAWDPWGNATQQPDQKKNKSAGASEGACGPLSEAAMGRAAATEMDGIFIGERLPDGEIRAVTTKKVGEKKKEVVKKKGRKEVVKKGFLANTGGKLYENDDGSHGSSEQSGPKYDPVEAQLAHLPEGLRKKCAIVDTTKMSPAETRDAMEQYANSGRVVSGPAAPGGSARQMSEREAKDFDAMLKKAAVKGAYEGAPEPSFALGLGGKGSKGTLKELPHECTKITHPSLECDAYNLVVDLPEGVEDMSAVDVEVSSLKAEVTVAGEKAALNLVWPSEIDADLAKAKFSKKKRTLTILAPVAVA